MGKKFKDGDSLEVLHLQGKSGILLNGKKATHIDIKVPLFRSKITGIRFEADAQLTAEGGVRVLCFYVYPKEGDKPLVKEFDLLKALHECMQIEAVRRLELDEEQKANAKADATTD